MTELITCPGCDGVGMLMNQLAKKRCEQTSGQLRYTKQGNPYYVTREGQEIPFKTIGGYCTVCKGTGKVPQGPQS